MSTRNPSSSSRRRVEASRRRFWKLPPESTTVRGSAAVGAGRGGRGGDRLVEGGGDLGARPPGARGRRAPPRSSAAPSPKRPRVRLGRRRRRPAARARSPPGPRRSPARARRAAPRRRRRAGPSPTSAARSRSSARRTRGPARRTAPAGRRARGRRPPMRHGSRIAAAPPGQRHRVEVGDALERRQVAAQELAAPERPVGAVAGAVEDERERRARARRARPGRRRRGRGGAARRRARRPARAPTWSTRYSGWRSCAIASGRTSSIAR